MPLELFPKRVTITQGKVHVTESRGLFVFTRFALLYLRWVRWPAGVRLHGRLDQKERTDFGPPGSFVGLEISCLLGL